MNSRTVIVTLAMAAGAIAGCANQEIAQQSLITQMKSGLGDLKSFSEQRQQLLDGFYTQERRSLDEAFDADVKAAPSLEPAWVIEHRRVYATAMEAIFQARSASASSHRQAVANIAAINEALDKLRWISQLRQNWAQMIQDTSATSVTNTTETRTNKESSNVRN